MQGKQEKEDFKTQRKLLNIEEKIKKFQEKEQRQEQEGEEQGQEE